MTFCVLWAEERPAIADGGRRRGALSALACTTGLVDRLNRRNGYRDRTLYIWLGSLNLKIPKLRAAATPRRSWRRARRRKKALVAVIQEAWIGGVSDVPGSNDKIGGRATGFLALRRARGCRNCARKSTSA